MTTRTEFSGNKRKEFLTPIKTIKRMVREYGSFSPVIPDLAAFNDQESPRTKSSRTQSPTHKVCPDTPLKQSPKSPLCTRTTDIVPFSTWRLRGKFAVNCSRFAPIRSIGRGKFSLVHQVQDLYAPMKGIRFYALKTWIDDIHGVRQLSLVASQMSSLDIPALQHNPNILRHLHFWQENSKFHLLTELCDQGTLESIMDSRTSPLSFHTLVDYAYQIINGLCALHEYGIIHADIKPANIFVTDTGMLRIGDFGCSFKAFEKRNDLEGDSKYIAPERLEDNVGFASDIFSLGISLYELVTDEDLPSHGSHWECLRSGEFSFQSDSPRALSPLPREFQELIRSMMDPDPQHRPTAASLLKHSLFSALPQQTPGTCRIRTLHIN